MIRPKLAILLALPLAAVLTVSSAQAQNYSQQPFRIAPDDDVAVERLPPPGTNLDENGDYLPAPRASRGSPQARGPQWLPGYRDAEETLPPPGFAPPLGRQPNAVPATQAQQPADDPGAPRPPLPVGGATQAQPRGATQPPPPAGVAALPPEDQPETGQPKELPANLKKQLVDYTTKEPAGTVIIDTPNTYLYLVLGGGEALRYGIGVGREGFTWAGTERVSRMKEWPDWFPPPEMIDRQPYLPRMMAGGPGNPLGARALYLGNTLYRIHGTNQPSTIGQYVSSGCIRLLNDDIEDLFSRVQVGTRVVVLPGKAPETVANTAAPGASATSASVMVEPPPAAVGSTGVSSRPPSPVR
jgi:lipoprotein-anchoring transpeptidase ErfK/SrfK